MFIKNIVVYNIHTGLNAVKLEDGGTLTNTLSGMGTSLLALSGRLDYLSQCLLHTHLRMSLPREMNTPFQGGDQIILEIKTDLRLALSIFRVHWTLFKSIM